MNEIVYQREPVLFLFSSQYLTLGEYNLLNMVFVKEHGWDCNAASPLRGAKWSSIHFYLMIIEVRIE